MTSSEEEEAVGMTDHLWGSHDRRGGRQTVELRASLTTPGVACDTNSSWEDCLMTIINKQKRKQP